MFTVLAGPTDGAAFMEIMGEVIIVYKKYYIPRNQMSSSDTELSSYDDLCECCESSNVQCTGSNKKGRKIHCYSCGRRWRLQLDRNNILAVSR